MSGTAMRREMLEQPAVLGRIIEESSALREQVRAMVPDPLCGVVFVGRGSSDNAAMLGRYAAELAARRPAGLAAPSLYTRYPSAVDFRGYLAVALSQSGSTEEVIAACEYMRAAGARVIAITNQPTSRLAEASELVLPAHAGEEVAIPATKTVTGEMALVLVVAAALGDGLPGLEELDRLPEAAGQILDEEDAPRSLAASWAGHDRCLVTARGLLYAAALETALKVKETARLLAEGISAADLVHGPIAAVDRYLPVLVLDGGLPLEADQAALLARLESLGAPTATCAPRAGSTLAMPAGLPEVLYAVLATIRGQQLAYELSLARGLDPDRPSGLAKVTQV
ncbi:MAG TPA: SIS domain-containing protein [Acidimicrobiales bacterium]|nr:SIS domain-containing protein [Acidimicrobiales bacterium]